jgi:hypothetical protein
LRHGESGLWDELRYLVRSSKWHAETADFVRFYPPFIFSQYKANTSWLETWPPTPGKPITKSNSRWRRGRRALGFGSAALSAHGYQRAQAKSPLEWSRVASSRNASQVPCIRKMPRKW